MKSEIFEYSFLVPKSAIDAMNHVNNVVYLQWVQNVAEKHWITNTNEQIRNKYVWVALNHYIEYHHPAIENDEIRIETWIEDYKGAKSERHTKIINTTTQKVLVSAKTSWCLLFKETLRPVRITSEISTLFS